MKGILAVLPACVLLWSCSAFAPEQIKDAVLYSYDDFGVPVELKGEILPLDTIWKPTRIGCRDSLLILVESTDDYFVHVFHREKKYKIARNIPFGIGPDERLNCWSLQFNTENVQAFDMQTGTLTTYPAPDFFIRSHVIPSRTVRLENGVTGAIGLPDGRIVASALSDTEHLLTVYDATGQKDTSVQIPYPELNRSVLPKDEAKRFFENRIYYHEKSDKIVLFYVYTDLIEIYDSRLRLLARIQCPDHFVPELEAWTAYGKKQMRTVAHKTKFAYMSGCLTDTEIYTLYYGILPERGKELQNRIFVYDYAGKPLRICRLDYPVSVFCVDAESRTLYGLSEQPEPCVIKFKMP
jgi:hypothetical protein